MFNYIVPVFNKEDILPLTLAGIELCAGPSSIVYVIIDGCSDGSEAVLDSFIERSTLKVIKLHMPNVHMLRSVNAALRLITSGYSVVMQDDIILKDPDFERKIIELYSQMGERLGVISLRLASNVRITSIWEGIKARALTPMIKEVDYIESRDDHYEVNSKAEYGQFYARMSAINGPNIIPWSVRSSIGILDEALAPYGYDDPEYCLRAMKAGFVNGLFPINYRSDIEWGGTRRSKKFRQEVARIHRRNRAYIWKKHGNFILKNKFRIQSFQCVKPTKNLNEFPKWDLC